MNNTEKKIVAQLLKNFYDSLIIQKGLLLSSDFTPRNLKRYKELLSFYNQNLETLEKMVQTKK